jgi:hypothetical protein
LDDKTNRGHFDDESCSAAGAEPGEFDTWRILESENIWKGFFVSLHAHGTSHGRETVRPASPSHPPEATATHRSTSATAVALIAEFRGLGHIGRGVYLPRHHQSCG